MSIAPLAILGAVNTVFSLIGSLAHAKQRSSVEPMQMPQVAPRVQESIWHELGKNINVHALTPDELASVSQILYQNGAIDFHTHAFLSFDPAMAGSTKLLTQANALGEVDWVAEFQARLQDQLQKGDILATEQSKQALDILARLQIGARGVTSVRV